MCLNRYLLRVSIVALVHFQLLWGRSVFARSSSENDAARTERAQGTVAVNLGRYDEAVDHFSRAYSLTQDPALLFSLAQSYRLDGKADKALSLYSAFIRAAASSPKYRSQIERAASEIESITSFMLNHPVDKRAVDRPSIDKRLIDEVGQPINSADSASPVEPPALAVIVPPPLSKPGLSEERKPAPTLTKVEHPMLTPKSEPTLSPAVTFTVENATPTESPNRPVYKRWWFWTGVVGALAAGSVATWWYTQPNNQIPGATYGSVKVLP